MTNWRVDDWLETLGLESYLNDFLDNGYENRDLCANLKPEELDVIGVKDKKHRVLLLEQAKLLFQSNGSVPDGVAPQNYTEPWTDTPQNYTEPWASTKTAYTEPWQQKNASDKKTNKAKGTEHTSETAVCVKKKGHATLPASIAKHHNRSVQPEQLPHFVGSTGELTKLQLKLKMKDMLQKDRVVLTEPPYLSKDGGLNQPALEELAENYGEKLAIDSERMFEALKEVWEFSMNTSTGALPAPQQKCRTLPPSISLPAGSDYQEPFKGPDPVKNSIPINKQSKEDIPILLITENSLSKPSPSPKIRPLSARLHDSKCVVSEPVYEEVDPSGKQVETTSGHLHKTSSHVESPSRQASTTSHSSVSDEVKKKVKPPNERTSVVLSKNESCSEESEDVFPPEPDHKLTSDNGNEATKGAETSSGGFMSKLFRKITTRHGPSSTKSLSVIPGSPKLPSSKSMPAIADMKAISKSSDDLLTSEYSEVFDKVPTQQSTQNTRITLPTAVESPVMPQEKTNTSKPPMTNSKLQSSPKRDSTDHLPKAGSTSMEHSSREGSVDDIDETCPIPYVGSKPSIAPKPHPRPSKKAPASDSSEPLGTPPIKPKRFMKREASPLHQTNADDKMADATSDKRVPESELTSQSMPATEANWDDDKNSKPSRPQPKPRPRNLKPTTAVVLQAGTAQQQGQGDREDSQPP